MKTRTKKLLAALMCVTMLFAFAGCGGPSTLEDYINENTEAKASLESLSSKNAAGDVTVDVKDNTIIYKFKLGQTVEGEMVKQMKDALDQYMKGVESTFENIASTFEEQSEIKGITVRVIYLNGDDSELYSKDFAAKAKAE